MSGSHGNRGKKRARSPSCCEISAARIAALHDTIKVLEESLEFESRISASLRRERDDAQRNATRWENDVEEIRKDLRKSQKSFSFFTTKFTDLQARIQETYPDFEIWSWRNPRPPEV